MITKSTLVKVAKLSKLGLSDKESSALTTDIESIIGYFEQIKTLNLENVLPMTHAVTIVLKLREDNPQIDKCIVDCLPYRKYNYFVVPPILE